MSSSISAEVLPRPASPATPADITSLQPSDLNLAINAEAGVGYGWLHGLSVEEKEMIFQDGALIKTPLIKDPAVYDNHDAFLDIEALFDAVGSIPNLKYLFIVVPNNLSFSLAVFEVKLREVFHEIPNKIELYVGTEDEGEYSEVQRGIYQMQALDDVLEIDRWFGTECEFEVTSTNGGATEWSKYTWEADEDQDDSEDSEDDSAGGTTDGGEQGENSGENIGPSIQGLSLN